MPRTSPRPRLEKSENVSASARLVASAEPIGVDLAPAAKRTAAHLGELGDLQHERLTELELAVGLVLGVVVIAVAALVDALRSALRRHTPSPRPPLRCAPALVRSVEKNAATTGSPLNKWASTATILNVLNLPVFAFESSKAAEN